MSYSRNLSIELANRTSKSSPSRGNRGECSRCRAVERQNSLREIFLEYRRHPSLTERVDDSSALTLDRRKSRPHRLLS